MKTVGKVILMMALSVSALSAVAKERICFTRQLTEGMIGTFSCHFYSPRKTGVMKMVWYPRASCLVSQGQKSKSCKVWSVMQLSRIELSTFAPAWHYSQKPSSHRPETSTQYQVRFVATDAERSDFVEIENVFDFDAGDLFPRFGCEVLDADSSQELGMLGWDPFVSNRVDGVLCSSGRIGLDGGHEVLMYSLFAFADGRCRFSWSTNGLMDVRSVDWHYRNGGFYDGSEKPLGPNPYANAGIRPPLMCALDSDTIRIRISNSRQLRSNEIFAPGNDDIRVSLRNLVGILDWLSKPRVLHCFWQAPEKCSLKERRIF